MVVQPTYRGRLTVREAWQDYLNAKANAGQSISDMQTRGKVHILPELGDLFVDELTAKKLRDWHSAMGRSPRQTKAKAGKPKYLPAPTTDDEIRARRNTANRIMMTLKAALNLAYDEDHVSNRDAWGRKLKPFANVTVARVRYLQIAEVQRLINASDPEFRALLRGALETGCRYSELSRLEVHDFNVDAGVIAISKSKSGKSRHVVLSLEGTEFFKQHCAGRDGNNLMFSHDGKPWKKSEQARPMREACERAKITPRISFHGLRHTWASLAAMNGMPLMVLAKNLGHADTRMVEKHYGHLTPSFVADAIRAGAPRYGIKASKKVVPLR
jgi:integrase